ncbi:M48 family metallopeptidase [Chloroflexota bacterium]
MWEQIKSNQIRSVILVTAMAALLLLIGYFLGLYFFDSGVGGLFIALIVWAVMSLVAFFQGDSILLSLSGARKIGRDDYPRLYNVVEEMKIASGLEKMPDIYIIDDPALNAFATGRDSTKASIAITSGLLQKLNRDELQGVVGHELAHIKNRDVLLMVICGVLLGTIVILAWYASRFLIFGGMGGSRRGSSRSGGGQAQIIILVVGIVLMILAPIIAQLIYFAVSRKREYLADASAALYTRYPEGLASALEKLRTSTDELKSANKATAPMYIINPFRKKGRQASDLSSTHPPISERVRILRAMAGGASFGEYDMAYRQVRSTSKGILSAPALAGVGAVGLRSASPPEPTGGKGKSEKMERTREVSDVMLHLSNYRTIDCDCGTKLKIPPSLKDRNVRCPKCGRVYTA